MVMSFIEAGFADHLMFSADASSGYSKTMTVFAQKLKAAGASEQVLHGIMVDNPGRFLAFVQNALARNDRRLARQVSGTRINADPSGPAAQIFAQRKTRSLGTPIDKRWFSTVDPCVESMGFLPFSPVFRTDLIITFQQFST